MSTIGEEMKSRANTVNFNNDNVQRVITTARNEASNGKYFMRRCVDDLPLNSDEKHFLTLQGFYITSETISWG